jgi:hypothetical protein
VLADAQFNVVPFLQEVPLNAVELQQALAAKQPVVLRNAAGPVSEGQARRYISFVQPYLYFFDVDFDQRVLPYAQKTKVGDYYALMLGPVGVKRPSAFQRRFPLDYMLYTHSLKDFYRAPGQAE